VSLAQVLLERLRALPPDKQRELLDFAEFLGQRAVVRTPRRSLEGLCADLGVRITEDDIADARREMWGGFPRDDIP